MKKIYILFTALLAMAGLGSCDMEKYPYNAVEENLYMKTVSDFEQARIGLYSNYYHHGRICFVARHPM